MLTSKQSGAVEACWAHNPEVRRSKLRSASYSLLHCNHRINHFWILVLYCSYHVPLAQRIARWTSNPKVLGSIPRWDDFFFFSSFISSLLLRASLGKKKEKKNSFSNPKRLHEGDIAHW